MNKQFKIEENSVDVETEVAKAVHDVELEGHRVPEATKELLRKNMSGEITGEEYRAIILANAKADYT